jgi:CRP/FNR family transcriptional regulator, cyclic AMP receptor protein
MNRAVGGAQIDTLRSVPLFAELDPAELQAVADSMHEANVPPGAVVTVEGGPGDGFFVIESGEAEVTVLGEARGTLAAGDYFGEIALLTGSDRTATITARTDMVCWGMTPWDFRPLVESNSAIAWKLLTAMADKLK